MALYIPRSILHLARSLYVRPETYGPTYVHDGYRIYIYIYILYCAIIIIFATEVAEIPEEFG